MMMNLAMTNPTDPPAPPRTAFPRCATTTSVRRAIAFISENWRAQPTIDAMADAAAVTPD